VIGINLIPPDVLQACRRWRRIRLWIAVTTVTAAAAALPIVWQLRQHARLAELTRLREDRTAETVSVRKKLADEILSLSELKDRTKRADALRTKRSWAGLLTLTTQCLPDEVWLTSISTEAPPPSAGPTSKSATSSDTEEQPTLVVMDGARRMALAGYAVGHEQLYEFMARLKQASAFARVDLLKADKEKVLWSEAVRFELACTW
jgi:Tfp pilus assembly protein PilN